jgi:restriction system protein
MPIPKYQEFMFPILSRLGDRQVHDSRSLRDQIASDMGISAEDRSLMLESGQKTLFDDRFHWAATYLRQSRLIRNASRGHYFITETGEQLLRGLIERGSRRIDLNDLAQFPEFQAFRSRSPEVAILPVQEGSSGQTPEELIHSNYEILRAQVASDLMNRILAAPPRFFEQLVVDLLVAMGYGGSRADAGRAIGGSGDDGVDGVINEDRLGLDRVYLQAKRWNNQVGPSVVREFAGSLDLNGATKGVLITTSSFSEPALKTANTYTQKKLVLIDGQRLTQLMIDYGVGVTTRQQLLIPRVDEDYFEA